MEPRRIVDGQPQASLTLTAIPDPIEQQNGIRRNIKVTFLGIHIKVDGTPHTMKGWQFQAEFKDGRE